MQSAASVLTVVESPTARGPAAEARSKHVARDEHEGTAEH